VKRTLWLATAALALAFAPAPAAEEVAGLPLHVARLRPNVIRVWLGDHISSTAVVAFATAKGVVVVDTFGVPKVDAELRRVVARELGRRDFTLLINTHEHRDHTGGNSVYADCTIVGHDLVAAGMQSGAGDTQRIVDWLGTSIAESREKLATLERGSPEYMKLQEELTLRRLNLEMLQSPLELVPPTKAFSDRLTLAMGDTTFDLYFIGGLHSASDIAALVPEHGILLTGDTMADTWLTDTPGCLASFAARPGVRHDFQRWLANWERLLTQKDRITLLLPGHWNGELSLRGAEARVGYVRALWEGSQGAARDGKGLGDVRSEFELEARFPDLATSPGFSARNHWSTVAEIWKAVTNQRSAAEKLHELVEKGAGESGIAELLAEREKNVAAYYFDEAEINAVGYRLLGEDKLDGAISVFKVNVTLFPDAWNVYDSLGEALLKAGNVAKATAMYEKSVALNPQNTNGKDVLARIRTGAAKQ